MKSDKKVSVNHPEKKDLDWHDNHVNQFEKIYEGKKAISYQELFQDSTKEGKEPFQKNFVMGAAGAGKTTLSQRIAYDWSQGEKSKGVHFPESIQLVIWIKLRNLRAYLSLEDLAVHEESVIKQQKEFRLPSAINKWGHIEFHFELIVARYICFFLTDKNSEPEDFSVCLDKYKYNVFYLLDGYDEIASLKETHPVKQVFEYLLKQPWVLVTSRPYHRISNDVGFRKIELLGFQQKDMLSYVDLHFKGKEDKPGYLVLKNLLQENNTLRELAHIPVNLEILCTIMEGWKKREEKESSDLENSNMTMLYQRMVFRLLKRGFDKKLLSDRFVFDGKLNDKENFQDKPAFFEAAKKRQILPCLGALALERLKTRKLKFSASFIKKRFPQNLPLNDKITFFKDVLTVGFIRGFKWNKEQTNFSGQGEFLHLTLQEFFAAWSIADAWIHRDIDSQNIIDLNHQPILTHKELHDLVHEYKYATSFAMVWPFIIGLLAQEKNKNYLNDFIKLIESPPLELRGMFHDPLRIRCIAELLPSSVPRKSAWENFVIMIVRNFEIQKEYWNFPDRTHNALQTNPTWAELLLKISCQMLQKNDLNGKKVAIGFIVNCDSFAIRPSLLNQLYFILKTESALKSSICWALCYLGARVTGALFKRLTEVLLQALDEEHAKVKVTICGCLSNLWIGTTGKLLKEINEEIIEVLLKALFDNNSEVIREACYTLCRVGAVTTGKQLKVIAEVLMKVLNNGDDWVRGAACAALGRLEGVLTEKVLIEEVIQALMKMSNNGYWSKQAAYEALGRLGRAGVMVIEKRLIEEIIKVLMKALGDEEGRAKTAACDALGRLGARVEEKPLMEIVEALLKPLRDRDVELSEAACKALGRLGARVTGEPRVVITEALVKFLSNDNICFHRVPYEILGQLGAVLRGEPQMSLTAVDKKLLMNLVESLMEVRDYGLFEKDRRGLCKVLGRFGRLVTEKPLEKITEALRKALSDEDSIVRGNAYWALSQLGIVMTRATLKGIINSLIFSWREYLEGGDDEKYLPPHTIRELAPLFINPFDKESIKIDGYIDPDNGLSSSFMLDSERENGTYFIIALDNQGNSVPQHLQHNISDAYFPVTSEDVVEILDAVDRVREKQYYVAPKLNRALFGLPDQIEIDESPNIIMLQNNHLIEDNKPPSMMGAHQQILLPQKRKAEEQGNQDKMPHPGFQS